MRKKLVVCVITALCLFVGASPWEGAAATAPEGELPGSGRFIATNSFPKNTIVDIVNIETNKSTRVIVANGLDSPGLLAIISREAAELIGMRPGSVSRIRMTQPSDPVAYVRFTEGLSSGVPEYDSGEVITEESYNEKFVNPSAVTSPSAPSAVPPPAVAAAPDAGYPAYVLEPEWGGAKSGARSARDIVDLPPYTAKEKEPAEPLPYFIEEAEELAGIEDEEVEEVAGIEEEESEEVAGIEEEEAEEVAGIEEEEAEEVAGIEEEEADEVAGIGDEEAEDFAEIEYEEEKAIVEAVVEYIIVPTDNRPPMNNLYGIDPNFIIPPITSAAKPETANNTANRPDYSGSVKYELSRGSYYVQLAAYDMAESAENIKSRIDQHYEPFVYKAGDRLYCVLLRPMNQGESSAVLARFKSIGYKDAFVRVAK
jgi:hypothetical protein